MDEIVRYKNNFVEAQYSFNLVEKKILIGIFNQIQQGGDFKKGSTETWFTFSITELTKLTGVNKENRRQIRNAIENILSKKITIIDDKKIRVFHLFSVVDFHNNGIVSIALRNELVDIIVFNIETGNYTPYHLENIKPLTSVYAIRIYLLLRRYINKSLKITEKIFTIIQLKDLMDATKKYKAYHDFKRKVLESAKKEINQKTDIKFTYEEIKTGRAVTAIKFKISKNTKEIDKRKEKKVIKNLKKQYENKEVAVADYMPKEEALSKIDEIIERNKTSSAKNE